MYVLAVAFALVLLLRASAYFLTLLGAGKILQSYGLRIFPWIQVLSWIAFTLWAADYLFFATTMHSVLLISLGVVFVAAAAWYILRDFFAGAVLRSDQVLQQGAHIQSGSFQGVVVRMGFLSLELKTDAGDRVRLPYSKLSEQIITRKTEKTRGKAQLITIQIPRHYHIENLEPTLIRKLLEMPWVVAEGEIQFKLTPGDTVYEAEIQYRSIKEGMRGKTEERLRAFIKEMDETS